MKLKNELRTEIMLRRIILRRIMLTQEKVHPFRLRPDRQAVIEMEYVNRISENQQVCVTGIAGRLQCLEEMPLPVIWTMYVMKQKLQIHVLLTVTEHCGEECVMIMVYVKLTNLTAVQIVAEHQVPDAEMQYVMKLAEKMRQTVLLTVVL